MNIPMKILRPTLLALICGLLLAVLNNQTRAVIEENRQSAAEKVFLDMVTAVPASQVNLIPDPTGFNVVSDSVTIARIDRAVTSRGYNGEIQLYVAYDTRGQVLQARVSHHRETPGIGDKIDREVSPWIEQFIGRSRQNTDWRLEPLGEIDGMSGATITASAVMQAINEALPE